MNTYSVKLPAVVEKISLPGEPREVDEQRNMFVRIDVRAESHGEALEKVAARLENLMWDLTSDVRP